MLDRARVAVQDGRTWKLWSKGGAWERGQGKEYTGKGGAYWCDGVSAQGADVTEGVAWHGVSSNQRTPQLFSVDSTLPGLELKNSP